MARYGSKSPNAAEFLRRVRCCTDSQGWGDVAPFFAATCRDVFLERARRGGMPWQSDWAATSGRTHRCRLATWLCAGVQPSAALASLATEGGEGWRRRRREMTVVGGVASGSVWWGMYFTHRALRGCGLCVYRGSWPMLTMNRKLMSTGLNYFWKWAWMKMTRSFFLPHYAGENIQEFGRALSEPTHSLTFILGDRSEMSLVDAELWVVMPFAPPLPLPSALSASGARCGHRHRSHCENSTSRHLSIMISGRAVFRLPTASAICAIPAWPPKDTRCPVCCFKRKLSASHISMAKHKTALSQNCHDARIDCNYENKKITR